MFRFPQIMEQSYEVFSEDICVTSTCVRWYMPHLTSLLSVISWIPLHRILLQARRTGVVPQVLSLLLEHILDSGLSTK